MEIELFEELKKDDVVKKEKTLEMVAKIAILLSIGLFLWHFSQTASSMFDSDAEKSSLAPILLYSSLASLAVGLLAFFAWLTVRFKQKKSLPIKEIVFVLLVIVITYAVIKGHSYSSPLVFIPAIIAFIIILIIAAQEQFDKLTKLKKEEGATEDTPFGKYLYGLSGNTSLSTLCLNKPNTLLWVDSTTHKPLGEIKKTSIVNIFVEDKSTASKRVTATRLLAVGIFALAFQKNKTLPAFYLIIEFNDGNLKNQAYFEFPSADKANQSNRDIRRYLKGIVPDTTTEPTEDAAPAPAPTNDPEARLKTVTDLKEKGLITDKEYKDRRAAILERV